MKIRFLRYGHANNSSSSHSLIFTVNSIDNLSDESSEFGWSLFTCSNKEHKLSYMMSCLFNSWHLGLGLTYNYKSRYMDYERLPRFSESLFTEWVTENLPEYAGAINFSASVDHQSALGFPLNRKDDAICIEFAKAWINEFVNNNYAILGGNDNDGDMHNLIDINVIQAHKPEFQQLWSLLRENNSVRTAFDPLNNHFVLSSGNDGTLMHLKFN